MIALVAAFSTWVLGHKLARESDPGADPIKTLKAGWFEIIAAPIAFFTWATAMPGSWYDYGANAIFVPALQVALVTLVIGGLATLLNRDQRPSPAPIPSPPPAPPGPLPEPIPPAG